jgi:hypothetical protein
MNDELIGSMSFIGVINKILVRKYVPS